MLRSVRVVFLRGSIGGWEGISIARAFFSSYPPTLSHTTIHQLLAHESIGANISDLDQGPLSHLTRLEVVDVEGTQEDYRVDFVSGDGRRWV